MLSQKRKDKFKLFIVVATGYILWSLPCPEGLDIKAWNLFAIFSTTIIAILIEALPVFTASLIALALSVATKTIETQFAYFDISYGFVLVILTVFLIARAIIKSGLAMRIAYLLIRKFGNSSLGLAYSIFLTDLLIAPAFPSNTARSGILYPIIESLSQDSGSKVSDGTSKKLGRYLMINGIASLSISSGLWVTAMATNPIGVKIANDMGINITFSSWFLYSSLPSFVAFLLLPYFIFKLFPPEITLTPNAPLKAKRNLDKMGAISKKERIIILIFLGIITLWGLTSLIQINNIMLAIFGIIILMITKLFTFADLKGQGNVFKTFTWFTILYILSSSLNHYGFMSYIGEGIANYLIGLAWPIVYCSLIILYVFIHYFFVSQTAQLIALFPIFLKIGIEAKIPPILISMMLLLATNFSSAITPQGSSANIIFIGSGYLKNKDVYKMGGIITLINTLIFLSIGSLWILILI